MAQLVLSLTAATSPAAQNFIVDDSVVPEELPSTTKAVALGDVDLDGDWDAAFADGSYEESPDWNRLWVNEGGLQGGVLGKFVDESSMRLPSIYHWSEDLVFVDIDGDGDLDMHVVDVARLHWEGFTGNKWWVNCGGKQGGQLGYYIDETKTRWVGLGEPGSSVLPSLVTDDGSFVNFCAGADFADLDDDGDLDLVISAFGTTVIMLEAPTRIFLNDGDGRFSEFNPSGFMPPHGFLEPGHPGLWCEGVFEEDTLDTTGAFCDPATYAFDANFVDIDLDFDLDVVLNGKGFGTRAFANRSEGSPLAPASASGLAFRDVTSSVFPLAFGENHQGQSFGDVDRDGDLDLAGVAWAAAAVPALLWNDGSGSFPGGFELPGEWPDEQGDFLDFDNDGKLDYYSATMGWDRLYRGDGATLVDAPLPQFWSWCTDVAIADTDGDGDQDVLLAVAQTKPNVFLRNVTEVPDVHPPYLPAVQALPDAVAAAGVRSVRAHVLDNAPLSVTRFAKVRAEATVEGVALPPFAAGWAGGQVFRAELPANLVGTVSYRFSAEDEQGNVGLSTSHGYAATSPLSFATPYGVSTPGSDGTPPTIAALSVPFAGSTLYLAAETGATPGTPALLAVSANPLVPGLPIPDLLLLQVAPPFLHVEALSLDANGDAVAALEVPTSATSAAIYAQFAVLDAPAGGVPFSVSNGLAITVP